MPAAPAVKELSAIRAQPPEDVFEVGCGSGTASQRGRIERPAAQREQGEGEQAAPDLEAAIGDVLVRHTVTGEVQGWPECEGSQPGAAQRPQRSTRCDMQRDDHDLEMHILREMSLSSPQSQDEVDWTASCGLELQAGWVGRSRRSGPSVAG